MLDGLHRGREGGTSVSLTFVGRCVVGVYPRRCGIRGCNFGVLLVFAVFDSFDLPFLFPFHGTVLIAFACVRRGFVVGVVFNWYRPCFHCAQRMTGGRLSCLLLTIMPALSVNTTKPYLFATSWTDKRFLLMPGAVKLGSDLVGGSVMVPVCVHGI